MTDCKNRSNEETMQGHCKDLYMVEMEKRLEKHVRNGTSTINDGLMQQDGMTTERHGGGRQVITYK